jgi:hypothetical protein
MALPFDIPDKNKRVWQCFVCGVEFEVYDEFCTHILDSHEHGREFLICPLDRCGAPVRDIKAHFRAKHPKDKLPQGMHRAIIWKDFTKNKKKTRKPNFRKGDFMSQKMNRAIHYRSGYECQVYEYLELWKEVLGYGGEPFEIPYSFEGKQHVYKPDLIVEFVDGKKEIWEIKPGKQTRLAQNKAKWAAAKYWCEARGWKFMVLTEKGIKKLHMAILEQRTEF